MDSSKIKNKVLQKLIDQMDERMVEDLKGKSPKFAKVTIQSDDPKLAEELKDNLVEGLAEEESEESAEEENEESAEEENEEEDDLKRMKKLSK